jgi:hypothetical protein
MPMIKIKLVLKFAQMIQLQATTVTSANPSVTMENILLKKFANQNVLMDTSPTI